jgi:hypothetical protein
VNKHQYHWTRGDWAWRGYIPDHVSFPTIGLLAASRPDRTCIQIACDGFDFCYLLPGWTGDTTYHAASSILIPFTTAIKSMTFHIEVYGPMVCDTWGYTFSGSSLGPWVTEAYEIRRY